MAEPYLKELRALVERLSFARDEAADLVCKHFFSGAAAYAGGHICMSLTPAGLALKLPPADCEALVAHGAKPLRYFPKAPVKKDYVVLPARITADEDALRDWIARSIAFVRRG